MNIVVVEDDVPLGSAIKRALERLSYNVTWLTTGTEALEALRQEASDLVLLDLGLPRKDGIEVLREARRLGVRTPVLVMTARDDVRSKVEGLDAGADDYVVKPVHLDELAARIRSLARRAQGHADNVIEAGALRVDLASFEVNYRGERVELTRREFALLRILMERAGRIVRRETIENSVYGSETDVGTNALEVLVHALRRKLSAEAIQTVRGFGYMIPLTPV
ncbi:response regulator transcription factor [Luteibacter anthropi]|uniref:response regulator n=1 Tax=Luteibacter anthropi TaxID=564369 RepID=UPI002032BBB3|nr:response regulator transcription factor [Luteibacter anthropi]URX61167.1 response regulator transcription factor [Luteibacter anthropi]